ncbi:MAG: carbamoyltransferase HypF [Lentisphaeria bacterium]|nr:carbamoyltransferase HypF [Lentisphaeria bacterium]
MRERFVVQLKGELSQGGFLPLLWRIVPQCKYIVAGSAQYREKDVELVLEGEGVQVMNFLRVLPRRIPHFYQLESLTLLSRERADGFDLKNRGFRICGKEKRIPEIRPDLAPCEKCLAELQDRSSRRFRYPFFACRECGPMYGFSNFLPLERKNTALVSFPPCSSCRHEAADREDTHHFGSSLLACPLCGPRYFVLDKEGELLEDEEPFRAVRRELVSGKAAVMQSVTGSFRLLADAFDGEGILRLRRKRKDPDTPYAVLFRDPESIRKSCIVSEKEEVLLTSGAAPYVLLWRKKDAPEGSILPSVIAPGTVFVAAGLPSSLAEHLLFLEIEGEELPRKMPEALVAFGDDVSGHGDFPGSDEIFHRFRSVTNCFLCHDLRTASACPDTICKVQSGLVRVFRRGRGIVPEPVPCTVGLASRRVCASFGTDESVGVALASRTFGIVPVPGFGGISGPSGAGVLERMLDPLMDLFDTVPDVVVCDMNSELASASFASSYAERHQLALITVQTHHALALACMAEHGLENALALVFTSGRGAPDGSLWGAECFEARGDSFARYASFAGHTVHCRKRKGSRPSRVLLDWFFSFGWEIPDALLEKLEVGRAEAETWKSGFASSASEENVTHSAEDLFESVTAALGLAPDYAHRPGKCREILEELAGEGKIRREDVPEEIRELFVFTLEESDGCCFIHWEETIRNLSSLPPLAEGEKSLYAKAFYLALGEACVSMIRYAASFTQEKNVVLSGEVFKDGALSGLCMEELCRYGFTVRQHVQTSPDDSSVCIGQAYAALLS